MCNDYRARVELGTIGQEFNDIRIPLRFPEGLPNLEPRDDIRITDRAPIIRAVDGVPNEAELVVRRWSWPGPGGKPVYNFRSDGREFASGRCLIVADGFYEFTDPAREPGAPKSRRKDKWLFTIADVAWFGIAGLWRSSPAGEAFTMLTAPPGPDVAPYHDRQVIALRPADFGRWLDSGVPARELLRPSPAGTFVVSRVELAAA